jgi:HSP20 family protein
MPAVIARRSMFDDIFRDVAPGLFLKPVQGDPVPAQIKVEVKETAEAYTVDAELPGVPKEDILVTIEEDVVTLRAEVKQQDVAQEGQRVLRSERYYGAVSRAFQLPQRVDKDKSRASFKDGVLRLTLPKQASASAQRLTIE